MCRSQTFIERALDARPCVLCKGMSSKVPRNCKGAKPCGDPSRTGVGWSQEPGWAAVVLTCEVLSELLLQLRGFIVDLICLFVCLPPVHFPAKDRRRGVLKGTDVRSLPGSLGIRSAAQSSMGPGSPASLDPPGLTAQPEPPAPPIPSFPVSRAGPSPSAWRQPTLTSAPPRTWA